MSRRCELTAKGARAQLQRQPLEYQDQAPVSPNLVNVTFISDSLGRSVRLRVSANALKSVDHRGGLDGFLLKAKDAELSPKAIEIKRQIEKKKLTAEMAAQGLIAALRLQGK
ncbi:MAG: bL28 family ribosomal protein [Rhodopseudomonas palustris]|nr:bL28 family ribosomal protein [Rhodopseudomonas palustris]